MYKDWVLLGTNYSQITDEGGSLMNEFIFVDFTLK